MNKLLLFVFLLSVSTFTFAQNGTAGDLTWTIDNRTLTISGNGVIPEYSYTDLAPWYNYRDSISTAVITEGVTRIGSLAFAMCQKLTSVSIAATVESIGATAFSKCEALDSIGLPEGVKTIEDGAFFYCTGLAAVSFPSTVQTIGNSIFYKCTKIAHVFVSAQTPPTCGQSVFPAEVLTAAVLHVPAGTKEAYQAADVWKDFASISDGSTFAQINKQRAGFKAYQSGKTLNIAGHENQTVSIYNLNGMLVLTTTENQINISGIAPGIYLINSLGTKIKIAIR